MRTAWGKVYVFISSTFNDMHAERDLLVKRVFPELQEWCERRRLRLYDIDLRWGVTEQDATHGKDVVRVCLRRIDECRPFFLCLLGQRYGWVPRPEDLSADTLVEFPAVGAAAGRASVTELEVLHAAVSPFRVARTDRAVHSFFYLRDPGFLDAVPADSPVRAVYRDADPAAAAAQRRLREETIPAIGRPVRHFKAAWRDGPGFATPELAVPLVCPSRVPETLARWQADWRRAGVAVDGPAVPADGPAAVAARIHNDRLTRGRLAEFVVADGEAGSAPLDRVVLDDLKRAIADRFPDHAERADEDPLQRELDQQDEFRFNQSQGYVERPGAFGDLDAYLADRVDRRVLVLTGEGGIGKSALLARWLDHLDQNGESGRAVAYRFVGAGDLSASVDGLLRSVWRELREVHGRVATAPPDDPDALRRGWPAALAEAGTAGPVLLVIDALNQLETGTADLGWVATELPAGLKLVVSCHRPWREGADRLTGVAPFDDEADRRRLVRAYLWQYLKELDEDAIAALVGLPGAANPLFLKVVLSELRVFGAFAHLRDQIRGAFGGDPAAAFEGVLRRLEAETGYAPGAPAGFVPLLFGYLAAARGGLARNDLLDLIDRATAADPAPDAAPGGRGQALRDALNLCLRQVRPFLARRAGRDDVFYESFRSAAARRYHGDPDPAQPYRRPPATWHADLAELYLRQISDPGPAAAPALLYDVRMRFDLEQALQSRWLSRMLGAQLELLTAATEGGEPAAAPDPMEMVLEYHRELQRLLQVDIHAAGDLIEQLHETGECVPARRLPFEYAEALAAELTAAGMPAEAVPAGPAPPPRWPCPRPRPYAELVYHQTQAGLWLPLADELADDEFRQRVTRFFGPKFYVGRVRALADRAAEDPAAVPALTRLRLRMPVNDFTRPLLGDLTRGLEEDLDQAADFLAACAADPAGHGRAIVALRALRQGGHVKANRRSAACRAALERCAPILLTSPDKRVRWEAAHVYWELLPRGTPDPLLARAEDEREHPLVRAEAARQLGRADEARLVDALRRLAAGPLYPLRRHAGRSARRIEQSLRLAPPGPIDDPTQAADLPTDLAAFLEGLGAHLPSLDLSQPGERPLIVHLVLPSELSVESRWREVELVERVLRETPCRLVCSESGTGNSSLTALKKIGNPDVWDTVAARYVHDLKLGAEEYLNLVTGYAFDIQGVDDVRFLAKAISEKQEGRRATELAASVARAQTMLERTLQAVRERWARVALLITSELPAYQIARLLGEDRQFREQWALAGGFTGVDRLGGTDLLESLLPEHVTPDQVQPHPEVLYVLARVRDPDGDLFALDINYIHSL